MIHNNFQNLKSVRLVMSLCQGKKINPVFEGTVINESRNSFSLTQIISSFYDSEDFLFRENRIPKKSNASPLWSLQLNSSLDPTNFNNNIINRQCLGQILLY